MIETVILAVPENYELIGGLYLPINEYNRSLSNYYDVRIIKMPYRFDIKKFHSYKREIYLIIGKSKIKAILAYGLNISYAVSRMIDKKYRNIFISLTRDSLYYGTLSSLILGKKINANSVKRAIRLIPYRLKENHLTRNCRCMVYASKWDTDKVSNGYGKVKADVVTVLNGMYLPESISKKEHNYEKEIVLGFIGYWTADYMDECVNPMLSICETMNNKNKLNIKLVLAGRNISDDQKKSLSTYSFVSVLGEVEHLEDFYNSIDIFISTVKKKNGILNKVIEAFSFKKCVVGFEDNFYAIEGCQNGTNCLIANTNEEFEFLFNSIKAGLIDADTIGENAYKLIERNYSWDGVLLPLVDYVNAL